MSVCVDGGGGADMRALEERPADKAKELVCCRVLYRYSTVPALSSTSGRAILYVDLRSVSILFFFSSCLDQVRISFCVITIERTGTVPDVTSSLSLYLPAPWPMRTSVHTVYTRLSMICTSQNSVLEFYSTV